ncbi:uncharacterized protein AB675_2890 [Cyphellophora attinorum]|uniref:BTB domain-containing protein n=1 Tax=Cyphellophora attinorum TaxID=1664694 RepID=A0A0N0NJ09_9EURO|nr:uncharacterized protein AB675_2890 [Phialophora attinorum]KPI36441.1 hypothetical protein AB675_2890 [Phialophora attinorum]
MSNAGTEVPASPIIPNSVVLQWLETGKYSDFVVRCKDKVFNLHKSILASRSEYFRAAIDGGFRESSDGIMTIEETHPCALAAIVAFLYTGKKKISELIHLIISNSSNFPVRFSEQERMRVGNMTGFLDIYQLADLMMLSELKIAMQKEIGRFLFENHLNMFEYHVRLIYETLPETDGMARPQLTTAIVRDPALSFNRSLSGAANVEVEHILDIAREHDPVGVTQAMNLLASLRRDGHTPRHYRLQEVHYHYQELPAFEDDEDDDDMGFGLFD